jgi:hypothetical protein
MRFTGMNNTGKTALTENHASFLVKITGSDVFSSSLLITVESFVGV